MAAKKKPTKAAAPKPPTIHEATCATDGSGTVYKGGPLTEAEAVTRRQGGGDVVVCGDEVAANRNLARQIEAQVSAHVLQHPAHLAAGPNSLPHYQPDPRPPDGHTFYEGATKRYKARKQP
jgi:hypothetical protein